MIFSVKWMSIKDLHKETNWRKSSRKPFQATFSLIDACLYLQTSEFYEMKCIKINFTNNCLSKILERFSCCFSIVWTQLQHRNIINSVFVNRLVFQNFSKILPLTSSTTTISICLTRKYKGLRVKYSFFFFTRVSAKY